MSTPSFEEAYSRLEQILAKMNGSSLALDDSISLYAEAEQLISLCNQKLTEAEGKIEKLLKKENGDLLLQEGKPVTEPFSASASGQTA